MDEVVTMIGAGATPEETEAVREVMVREGFSGPCEAVVGAQGEGFSIIVIQIAVPTLLAPFVQDGYDRLKRFFVDMHDARNDRRAHRRQTYIRPDAVTREEWEQTKPYGRMPGWRTEGATETELVLTDRISDEAWKTLLELDFETLPAGSYWWNPEARAWERSGHN